MKNLVTFLLKDGTTRSGVYGYEETLNQLKAAAESGKMADFCITEAPEGL